MAANNMTVFEEVQLAIDLGIEDALNFVYLEKVNYCRPTKDDHYVGIFNGREVLLSSVRSRDMWFAFGDEGHNDYRSPGPGYDYSKPLKDPMMWQGKKIVGNWTQSLANYNPLTGKLETPINPSLLSDKDLKKYRYKVALADLRSARENLNGVVADLYKNPDEEYYQKELSAAQDNINKCKRAVAFHRAVIRAVNGEPARGLDIAGAKAFLMADVVRLYGLEVIRTGSERYKMRCPFHNDDDPSLVIYTGSNKWWCFGCSCGGDSIDFVSKYENMSISQAVKKLST